MSQLSRAQRGKCEGDPVNESEKGLAVATLATLLGGVTVWWFGQHQQLVLTTVGAAIFFLGVSLGLITNHIDLVVRNQKTIIAILSGTFVVNAKGEEETSRWWAIFKVAIICLVALLLWGCSPDNKNGVHKIDTNAEVVVHIKADQEMVGFDRIQTHPGVGDIRGDHGNWKPTSFWAWEKGAENAFRCWKCVGYAHCDGGETAWIGVGEVVCPANSPDRNQVLPAAGKTVTCSTGSTEAVAAVQRKKHQFERYYVAPCSE